MYDSISLANYIILRCNENKKPISNLQLQKILFYIQLSFLKRNRLAFGDTIEAWTFGPVVPNVYYHFCGYGSMPIVKQIEESYNFSCKIEDRKEINKIIDQKSLLDPWDSVLETQSTNSAWDKTYQKGIGNKQPIPIKLMKEAAMSVY